MTVDEIEAAVSRLEPAEFAAFRDWFDALADRRLGLAENRSQRSRPPALERRARERLIADAQRLSRALGDDLAERTLLDEIENIEAENAVAPG